ncbi:MAG: dehydrogenase [Actinobacteria bacterium]|nr:MAG: dehydrogenase [Actinomycetota bacterium]
MDVAEFQERAAGWLSEHKAEAPRDYGAILPPDRVDEGKEWQARLFEAGFAGLHWPVEHGGQGLSSAHTAAWIQQCAIAQVPPFINMVGPVLAGGSILLFGTDGQRSEHLRPIITGERVWCQLFSEPEAGSDLASLATRAEADGEEYVVTGQKVWCSNGRVSDWGILMARTDPGAPKHKGISFFLVDMSLPGIDTRPLRQMNGEAEFDEVFFDGARIPADCLLGPLNDGWNVGMATLMNERGHIGASGIALDRRLDSLAALAADLEPLRRQELVGLYSRGRAFRSLGQRQGPVANVAGSLMKLGITEQMFDYAMFQASLLGPAAMLDNPATAQMLSAPGARIAGGTSQVQRNIIGERLLGLPKEPRPAG